MSRLGKQIINVPTEVKVEVGNGRVVMRGPRGELTRVFKPEINITLESGGGLKLVPRQSSLDNRALWGTYAAHLKNMIKGVVSGFEKKLLLEGVGYRAALEGKNLKMNLGFSHPVVMAIPEGLEVKIDKGLMTITGQDCELVGQFAARVRAHRPPEPYKGKGFRYEDEIIHRKQGKKVVA